MKSRAVRIIPPVLVVVGALAAGAYVILGITGSRSLGEMDFSFGFAFGMFIPLGAFIALRRPRNPIGWIMTAIGFTIVASAAATEYATQALLLGRGSLPAGAEASYLSSVLAIPGLALMPFLMLLFPSGSLPSRRWRWVAYVAAANVAMIFFVQLMLWPFRGPALLREEPPAGFLVPEAVFELSWMILMASAVAGLLSLVIRFRSSSGVERQQLKWMAYVAGVLGTLVVWNFFVLDPLHVNDAALRMVSEQALNVSAAGFPIAAAIAISRYRLYEIDVVINRTLVYGALTAILVATYIGLVFLFQRLLAPVTAESDLAVAASTLAVAALFRPLRARIQGFIDHRFYRRKFDAQKTVEDFGAHLRDEVDLESLTHRFVSAVQDTMQPAHVSLWLREEERA